MMDVEILPDGTIIITTGDLKSAGHYEAHRFIEQVSRLAKGQVTVQPLGGYDDRRY